MTTHQSLVAPRWMKFWLLAISIGLFGSGNLFAQCNLVDFTGPGNPQSVTLYLDASGQATLDQAALVGILNPQGTGCSLFFYEFPTQAVALGASVSISCNGSTPYGPGNYYVVADDDGIPGGNESQPEIINVILQDTIGAAIAGGDCGMTVTANVSDDDSDDCDTYVTFTPPTITENCFTGTSLTINYTATTSGTLVNALEVISNAALQDSMVAWAANGFKRKFYGSTSEETGTTEVTFTVNDGINGPASCMVVVDVEDDENPMIDCPDDVTVSTTSACIASGFAGISIGQDFALPLANNAYFDNCEIDSVDYMISGSTTLDWTRGTNAANASFNLGLNTVSYRATDFAGNTVMCSFTVTVIDQVGPSFVNCPLNITETVDLSCDTTVMWVAPTVADNCDPSGASAIVTSSHSPGDAFPVGVTTVTYRALDAAGNETLCSFTVTVQDNGAPSITCPGEQDLFFCAATDLIPDYTHLGVVTDNCMMNTVTQANAGLALNDGAVVLRELGGVVDGPTIGDTVEIVLVVTDNSTGALSDMCTFDVVLRDITGYTNPVPTTSGINLPSASYECGSLVLITPTAEDFNCPPNLLYGIPSISSGTASLTPASLNGMGDITSYNFSTTATSGTIIITWTYTDANNVTSTQFQSVDVVPNAGPFLTSGLTSLTVNLDANGMASVSPADFFAAATDDCSVPTITINGATSLNFDCDDTGVTNATLLASDGSMTSNGIIVTITIQDAINPVLLGVPPAVTVECDAIPAAPSIGTDITATDNCGITGITQNTASTQSGISSDCSNYNYTITRSWTASDPSGNQTTFSQVVTVEDTEEPIFTAPDTIEVSAGANCLAAVTFQITAAEVTDNCAPFADLSITNGNLSGNYTVGTTTRFITAIDPCGNSAVHIIRIIVEDDTPPIASCLGGPSSVSLPPSDTLILPSNFFNNGSQDNCDFLGLNNFSLSRDTFTCVDAGLTFPVTMTVTDNSGNSASCGTTIQIQDNIAPVAICQDITVTLDNSGFANIAAIDMDNGSFDNCTGTVSGTGSLNFTANQLIFGPADVNNSPVEVELYVQDLLGNRDTCTSNVTVEVPETCFDVIFDPTTPPGSISGTAATTIQVPVVVTDFINVQGFQFLAVIDDGAVATFDGTSGNTLPGSGFITNIVSSDTMNIQWFNNASMNNPATLADGTAIFNLDVNLIGAVNASTRIRLIGTIGVPAEITRSYSNTPILGVPCTEDGIVIIDNPAQLTVAGTITTEIGVNVGNVVVDLVDLTTGGASVDMTIGANGQFNFNPIPAGRDYDITPSKDINWINGVSVNDLSIIQKHIVGIDTLTSPYKKIAADAFPDNSITTFDVVQLYTLLQTVVPGPPTTPTGNTSWRFVPKDFVIADTSRRVVREFPDSLAIDGLAMDTLMNDFIAVKIGQVEDTDPGFDPNNVTGSGSSAQGRSGQLTIGLEDRSLEEGETFEMLFRAKDFRNIQAYQSVLEFDPALLSFETASAGVLNNFDGNNVGAHAANEGILTMLWFDVVPATIDDEEVLFSISFKANAAVEKISDIISLGNYDQLPNTAYNGDNQPMDVQLVFNNQTANNAAFQLFQNRPNPFKDATLISFSLPKAGFANLSIMDVSGRIIKTYEDQFQKGYNEIQVSSSDLPAAGVLYYQLDTDGFTAVKKMVIIE